MGALGRGDLAAARATADPTRVVVTSRDEVGAMAVAFNEMHDEVTRAAWSLDSARDELRRSRQELEHLAAFDALTDLPNRRHLEQEIDRILLTCTADAVPATVVVLDLDGFKYINDSRGHAVGDGVLMRVARLLELHLRDGDVVGRLGGDEFAAVLPGATEEVLRRVLEALRSEVFLVEGGRAVRLTGSVGLASVLPGRVRSAQDLLIDADVAMYDAKDAGRDRLAVASVAEPRQSDHRSRHTWSERIRDALDRDLFVLHAQPLLDLATGRVDRYELLLRMVDDDGALIAPGAFLPTAERSGLIARIDRWVVVEACRLLGRSQRVGEQLRFAVNLSGPSMGDPDMLRLLERELAGLPRRGGLVIEVTETAAIVDVERAKAFAERLGELGCAFALDDFGAGYGSFYYLKHLPFDYLKIDGEFVRGVVDSLADQVVVRSLVTIARELGKRTVAEFVETPRRWSACGTWASTSRRATTSAARRRCPHPFLPGSVTAPQPRHQGDPPCSAPSSSSSPTAYVGVSPARSSAGSRTRV